jgi:hypothetical protein
VNLAEFTQTGVKLVATYELAPDESISGSALGDDRLFLALRRGYGVWGLRPWQTAADSRRVLGDAPLAATGSRAVLAAGWRGQLSIINAENAERPELVREVELSGSPWQVTAAGNLGIVSMGYDGVEVVSLSPAAE